MLNPWLCSSLRLIRNQGIGDLYQIHALCLRDGNDFNLAYIPSDFIDKPSEGFDPVYMKKLLDRGYQKQHRCSRFPRSELSCIWHRG